MACNSVHCAGEYIFTAFSLCSMKTLVHMAPLHVHRCPIHLPKELSSPCAADTLVLTEMKPSLEVLNLHLFSINIG